MRNQAQRDGRCISLIHVSHEVLTLKFGHFVDRAVTIKLRINIPKQKSDSNKGVLKNNKETTVSFVCLLQLVLCHLPKNSSVVIMK